MFNVVARNEDDHLKNLAWLYDGQAWTLAPAFDLSFAPHPSGYRQTSVMGVAQDVTRYNLLDLATGLGLSRRQATAMLEEVLEAASGVDRVLAGRGCSGPVSKRAATEVLSMVRRLES